MAEIQNQIEDIADKTSNEGSITDQEGEILINNGENNNFQIPRETIESRKRPHEIEGSTKEKQELSFKRQRFEARSEKSQYDWQLPPEMLEYAERHFNTYIKDTDLKDNVLDENPVPDNV